MQTVVPNIWCNSNALEVAEHYATIFPNTEITNVVRYPTEGLLDFQQPMAGQPLTVDVEIQGYQLTLINADDTFRPNPSISFMVTSANKQLTQALWDGLHEGGRVLMDLGEYPFNPFYGWVEDKFGVSWQLMTSPDAETYIYPSLMFCGRAQNRAHEAIQRYVEVIDGSAIKQVVTYADFGHALGGVITKDSVVFSTFTLAGQKFGAMDSAVPQDFDFDCGLALLVNAHGQEQLDRYWNALSAVPEAERCGWLRDEFGLAWEIVPDNLDELMSRPGAYEKLMSMGKIIIADF
ncbi:VOC family protein [Corynebacterium kozikiae]|uniref:VOC family protein n=1 Tax=Corynebacterium kozikiae TaxID=2968469 RepID=UPI00211CD894|nr:VOC family protein [Corynebacterium sp. 76QC2CO]MCQ9342618.1 VOC family protein [Corynebacterium sp. 76QC2CO]